MGDSGDLNLTSDEITKLKKAFKDPEFQKLFREYAEEISDPANKKKYAYGDTVTKRPLIFNYLLLLS